MAYDANDDRSNDPSAVLRRAGITTKKENSPGNGWLNQNPRKNEIGREISPGNNGTDWGDNGNLRR
ncbi:hypothetical protein ACVWZ4_006131 [Bradyrhizobium sp. USDA 4472]